MNLGSTGGREGQVSGQEGAETAHSERKSPLDFIPVVSHGALPLHVTSPGG